MRQYGIKTRAAAATYRLRVLVEVRGALSSCASPSGFVVAQANSTAARDMLVVAQDQHRQVLDAIVQREGARAEAIMREHSRLAQRNLRTVVQSPRLDQLPGVRLIRKQRA